MLNKIRLIFLTAICLICANNLSAQIYEGFNYPQNMTVTGQNGGTGWGGSWQTPNTGLSAFVTNPFVYPGVPVNGGALEFVNNQNNPTRVFASPIAGTSGTSVRFSFILSAGLNCSLVGLRVWDSNSNGYIEPGCANNKWKINTNAGANYAAANSYSAIGAKYVVVQIDFQNGNDRMRLWVNPTVLSNLSSGSITSTPMLDISTTDLSNLNKVEWISANSLSIDEIRIEKVQTGAANDYFGSSVDIWTDVNNSLSYIVVGAPRCDMSGNIASPAANGKAYIFTLNGSGMVTLVATLSASDATAGDCFGRSVAIDNGIVVVGADKADDVSGIDQGKAYLFQQSGGNWTQFKILNASDAAAGDRFGNDVEISSDKLIVGAFQAEPAPNSPSITNQGQAYVFEQDEGGTNNWGQKNILVAGEPPGGIQNNDQFGYSVAIDSSGTALVGAISKDAPFNVDKGAVYAFAKQNSTPFDWTQTNKLTDPSGAAGFYFGTSVAIDPISKTGIVGAFGTKNPTNSEGKAFLFDGNNSWTPAGTFSSTTPNQGDGFGWSVAIYGSAVIVGEYYGENASATPQNSGAAFFSRKTGSTWTAMQQRTGNPTASIDYFGNSVAIFGNISVIGAPYSDVSSNSNQGRAFIYTGSVTNPTQYYVLTN